MTALYNEIDPFAAAWLRKLIAGGHIAPGIVVETSIEDLTPNDLKPFHQVHFFAGIGVWSYALRRIGWPDDRPIWTGSCPCQPFSAAGKGNGFADERHLWPHFFHLITQCRPAVIVGEQVASKDGLAWLDLVQTDMEGAGHAFGAVDLCAAGVGSPHIRQRLWWVGKRLANADQQQRDRSWNAGPGGRGEPADLGAAGGMADAPGPGPFSGAYPGVHRGEESAGSRDAEFERPCAVGGVGNTCGQPGERDARAVPGAQTSGGGSWRTDGNDDHGHSDASTVGRMAHANSGQPIRQAAGGSTRGAAGHSQPSGRADDSSVRRVGRQGLPPRCLNDREDAGRVKGYDGSIRSDEIGLLGDQRTGPTNGLWRDADWLFCRDGKWRPVEPGTFPLVNGAAARVGRLRGYGNAIVAPVAEEFLKAALLDEPVNSAV